VASIQGKRVLVTGGAGFIGSHLVDQLIEEDVEKIVIVDNFFLGTMDNLEQALQNKKEITIYRESAADFYAMEAIFKKEGIDIVFNMATKALIYSFFNPIGAYMENVEIVRSLLELQKEGFFQTLIQCSSSEAYGTAQYTPMDENHPLLPTTPYAAGKAAADLFALSFYKTLDLDIRIVRPFNNYGPRQNMKNLAGVIPLTIQRISKGLPPIIEGTGEQTRDFIFVKDTAYWLLQASKVQELKGKIVNLGTGNEIKIKNLVEKITSLMNYQGNIRYEKPRTADVLQHCASTENAVNILGFRDLTDLEKGLSETVGWYKKCMR